MIENMMNWHHSGINVYCGKAIWPHNEQGLENLARYIKAGEISLIETTPEESAAAKARLDFQRKKRRECHAKKKHPH